MNERILNFQSRDTIIKDTWVYKRVYTFAVCIEWVEKRKNQKQ